MELEYGKQINLNSLTDYEIDVIIISKNHEKRWDSLLNNLRLHRSYDSAFKLLLTYENELEDEVQGFKTIKPSVTNTDDITLALDSLFLSSRKEEITVLIDYSCMTKVWYYTIMLYFSQRSLGLSNAKLLFSYTPSKFSKPQLPKHNNKIEPLPGKYRIPQSKPKALIVCLGYEEKKAEGIIDYLDPKETIIIYSKPTIDKAFSYQIETSNKDLLDKIDRVITYQFDNLVDIEGVLYSLYITLKNEYSIIIAPLGPKPFTFMAMLMSLKYNEIDIWRVSSGSDINKYPRDPIENHCIISEVQFVS